MFNNLILRSVYNFSISIFFQPCFGMVRKTMKSIHWPSHRETRWAKRRDQQVLVPLLAWQSVAEGAYPYGAVQWFALDDLRHMCCLHCDVLVFPGFVARICSCRRAADPFLNMEPGDRLPCGHCDVFLLETAARSLLRSHLHQWKPKFKSFSYFQPRRNVEKIQGDVGALGPQLEWPTLVFVRAGFLFEMQKRSGEAKSVDHDANICRSMLNHSLPHNLCCHAGCDDIAHWGLCITGAFHWSIVFWSFGWILCLDGLSRILSLGGHLGRKAWLHQFWPGHLSLLRMQPSQWNWPTSRVWPRGVEAMRQNLVRQHNSLWGICSLRIVWYCCHGTAPGCFHQRLGVESRLANTLGFYGPRCHQHKNCILRPCLWVLRYWFSCMVGLRAHLMWLGGLSDQKVLPGPGVWKLECISGFLLEALAGAPGDFGGGWAWWDPFPASHSFASSHVASDFRSRRSLCRIHTDSWCPGRSAEACQDRMPRIPRPKAGASV